MTPHSVSFVGPDVANSDGNIIIITWRRFCRLQPVPSESWTSSSRKVWQTRGWPVQLDDTSGHTVCLLHTVYLCPCVSSAARPCLLCGGHASFMVLPPPDRLTGITCVSTAGPLRPAPSCSILYQSLLQSHYPADSASLSVLNNPYSCSIFRWMELSGESS